MKNESIKLDVKVGDTILTGKFKNKKTVVKSITYDDFGMPEINGRKVVTFRPIQSKNEGKQMGKTIVVKRKKGLVKEAISSHDKLITKALAEVIKNNNSNKELMGTVRVRIKEAGRISDSGINSPQINKKAQEVVEKMSQNVRELDGLLKDMANTIFRKGR